MYFGTLADILRGFFPLLHGTGIPGHRRIQPLEQFHPQQTALHIAHQVFPDFLDASSMFFFRLSLSFSNRSIFDKRDRMASSEAS
jgi:hypothetical protein